MKGREVVTGLIALALYTGAVVVLAKEIKIPAARGDKQPAVSSNPESCGAGGMACGEMMPRSPVAQLLAKPKSSLSDKQKAAIESAQKRHRAAIEKANAQLMAAIAKAAKLEIAAKKDLGRQLDVATGISAPSVCGGMGPKPGVQGKHPS